MLHRLVSMLTRMTDLPDRVREDDQGYEKVQSLFVLVLVIVIGL